MLLLWLLIGFSLGTSLLMGPVRWLMAGMRSRGTAQWLENGAVVLVILGLGLVSALVARWATATVLTSPAWHVRAGIWLLALLLAGAALTLWLQPRMMATGARVVVADDSRFAFGPYPERSDLERLKREGYTAVVSLLHPAVAPFEPALLERQREAARRVGIELIHVPMLPWVSRNREALETLRELADEESGRYYVHCYLGRDRVNLARRALGQLEEGGERPSAVRDLLPGFPLERGEIVALDEDVFLTGLPTDEELLYYVANAGVDHVVSLLDPRNAENLPWIRGEREALENLAVPLHEAPLANPRPDPEAVEEAVALVRSLEGRVLVHDFLAPSTDRAPAAEAFAAAYRRGRPPVLVRFLRRALPDLRTVILFTPLFLLAAAIPARWVGRLRTVREMPVAYTRKIFHFCIFTLAAITQVFAGLPATMVFGSVVALVVLYAVLQGSGLPFYEALARPSDRPHRTLFILLPLVTTALGGVLSNLFFGRLAYVGYLVAGWGDAVGEPVGAAMGRHRYRVPSLAGVSAERSWEGSTAVLVCGVVAAAIGLGADGYHAGTALLVGLAAGAVGAVVEAITTHGLDNLTIQVAAGGAAYGLIVVL